jgi:CheY-like chemotaxis protein
MTTIPSALNPTILLADDDPEDRELMRLAIVRANLSPDRLRVVEDGDDLLDYLRHQGAYAAGPDTAPVPTLLLLDLRMPKRDGFSALEEIRRDPALRRMPVVIMTTSSDLDDVERSYELGANSYITKPATLSALAGAVQTLRDYWFSCVSLPGTE